MDNSRKHIAGSQRLDFLDRTATWLFFAVALLIALRFRGRQAVPFSETNRQVPVFAEKAHRVEGHAEQNQRFVLIQTLFAIISIGLGLLLISFTRVPITESKAAQPHLVVTGYIDQGYSEEDIAAARDYDIYIRITAQSNRKDTDVLFAVQAKSIVSSAHTPLKPPKFRIEWPGKVELASFSRDVMAQYYQLTVLDNSTVIEARSPEFPTLELTWFDSVESLGAFKKEIALDLAESVYRDTRIETNERGYTVFVLPDLPSNTVVTYSSPKLEDLSKGIIVAEKMQLIGDSTYTVANSNFDIVYEENTADEQRNLLVLIAGILLGLGGNFLVNAITAIISPSVRV